MATFVKDFLSERVLLTVFEDRLQVSIALFFFVGYFATHHDQLVLCCIILIGCIVNDNVAFC